MDDLESINKLTRVNYWDQEVWDEDKPTPEIPVAIQKEFEDKEHIYNNISEGISIKVAYVLPTNFIGNKHNR
jgi:hypothetical protein